MDTEVVSFPEVSSENFDPRTLAYKQPGTRVEHKVASPGINYTYSVNY